MKFLAYSTALILLASCSHKKTEPKSNEMSGDLDPKIFACNTKLEQVFQPETTTIKGVLKAPVQNRENCSLSAVKNKEGVGYLVVINSQKGNSPRKVAGSGNYKLSQVCELKLTGSQEVSEILKISFNNSKEAQLELEIANNQVKVFRGSTWRGEKFICYSDLNRLLPP